MGSPRDYSTHIRVKTMTNWHYGPEMIVDALIQDIQMICCRLKHWLSSLLVVFLWLVSMKFTKSLGRCSYIYHFFQPNPETPGRRWEGVSCVRLSIERHPLLMESGHQQKKARWPINTERASDGADAVSMTPTSLIAGGSTNMKISEQYGE